MGVREAALEALQETLEGLSEAQVAVPPVVAPRNADEPEEVPAGGLVILRDGDPGEPTILLSPTTYCYEHRAEVEVWVQAATAAARDALLDQVLGLIPALIAADPTLGMAVDYTELREPELESERFPGAANLKVARVPVILSYDTTSPLT